MIEQNILGWIFNLFKKHVAGLCRNKCLTPEVTRVHTQCFQNHCKVKIFFSFLFHFHFSFTFFFPPVILNIRTSIQRKKITGKKKKICSHKFLKETDRSILTKWCLVSRWNWSFLYLTSSDWTVVLLRKIRLGFQIVFIFTW